jgi:hypothetical protein
MIKDKTIKQELRDSWHTVLSTKDMIARNNAGAITSRATQTDEFRNLTNNLLLLFGFSVVEKALLQFKDEGNIKSSSNQLGSLMKKSKNKICWVNYDLIREAKKKRDLIAHEQIWISRDICWKYLDAIEVELINWGVLH